MIWKILSLLTLVLPLCAVVLGLLCWRYPPGGPTWAFGFRSRRARAGDASWAFAQEWAGKCWFLGGLTVLLVTLLVCDRQREAALETMLPVYLKLVAVQIGLLLLLVITMNVLLLVKFDRFGRRRKPKIRSKSHRNGDLPETEDEADPDEQTRDDYPEEDDYGDDADGEDAPPYEEDGYADDAYDGDTYEDDAREDGYGDDYGDEYADEYADAPEDAACEDTEDDWED